MRALSAADGLRAREGRGASPELPVRRRRGRLPRVQAKKLLLIEKNGNTLLWQRPPHSPRLAAFWELPEHDQLPDAPSLSTDGAFRHTIVHTTYLVEV